MPLEKVLPPGNLFRIEMPGPDFDCRRGGGFPVTEALDQAEVKDDIVEELFGCGMQAFPDRLEYDFGRK
jgi:hypothetical protein